MLRVDCSAPRLPNFSAPFASNVISPTSSSAAGASALPSASGAAAVPTALANENFDIFRVDNAAAAAAR